MKVAPGRLVMPLVAVAVLGVTLQQTLGALRASGSWRTPVRAPAVVTEDPYARVDELLGQSRGELSAESMRNPFGFAGVRAPVAVGRGPAAVRPVIPKPPPRPTLTSIIWDADPRATVRYDGRDFSVRVNSLFADFRVKSITSNEVVLDRGGESIVLSLRPKGD